MLRACRIALLASAMLVAGAAQAFAQDAGNCADVSPTGPGMESRSKVATAEQPARVLPKEGTGLLSRSPALRLTLRPTAADPDSPFLAQVFAKDMCGKSGNGPGLLLGVVSFFPLRVGQSQEFVLAAPEQGFPSVAPQNVQLTVKLVPANPERSLANTSVEVVNARFAE
jgi:hypothetical protein